MILLDIKQYLSEVKQASQLELSQRFDLPPAVLSDMLSRCARKGWIREQTADTNVCAKGCSGCEVPGYTRYCWVAREGAITKEEVKL